MDSNLLLIFGFVILICLIAFPFSLMIQRRVAEQEERKLELEARIAEAKSGKTSADSEDYHKLEERVRVLERIATDKDVNLAKQIEALRDVQEIEQLTSSREKAS